MAPIYPLPELENEGVKLSLNGDKMVYEVPGKITEQQLLYLSDNKQQIMAEIQQREKARLSPANNWINSFSMPEDRSFVRKCLAGISGSDRTALVIKYLDQWQQGIDAEPIDIKKNNAGRYRANVWIREEKFYQLTTIEEKYND